MKNFYITTTLPYVNAEPHIGFATEIIKADVIARYHRLMGEEVFFNTGTDEHGLKIYRKALERGIEPQAYVDEYATKFDQLKQSLNLSYNSFIRTTDENHVKAAQEFWRLCEANGDIYKKNYQVKYCVGCELEKTESELVNGECPHHPGQPLEEIDEENYFFRWSKYQDALLELYDKNKDIVLPDYRLKEIRNFVANGLQDFSISRLKEKMPWGVPVPGDENHVMYVWFDALVNYISCLGWPDNMEQFEKFWPGMQVAGKDNLRQQSAMWQAMLMSAGLPNAEQVLIFGFINSGGKKMSKSLGNVINPYDVVEKYGTDATRYYLLAEIKTFEDGDYTEEKMRLKYNADLANGIGNLTSRILSMAEKYTNGEVPRADSDININFENLIEEYHENFAIARLDMNMDLIMNMVAEIDSYIAGKEPWRLAKEEKQQEVETVIYGCLQGLKIIAQMLKPFLPQTAEDILLRLGFEESDLRSVTRVLPPGQKLRKGEPLFVRIEEAES